jgi:hypothetical protein
MAILFSIKLMLTARKFTIPYQRYMIQTKTLKTINLFHSLELGPLIPL